MSLEIIYISLRVSLRLTQSSVTCSIWNSFFFPQHGITQTSNLVNITDFFQTYILPELQASDGKTFFFFPCLFFFLSTISHFNKGLGYKHGFMWH